VGQRRTQRSGVRGIGKVTVGLDPQAFLFDTSRYVG